MAARFESLVDPIIMLVTVPMSICGALLVLNLLALTNSFRLTALPRIQAMGDEAPQHV